MAQSKQCSICGGDGAGVRTEVIDGVFWSHAACRDALVTPTLMTFGEFKASFLKWGGHLAALEDAWAKYQAEA